MRDYIVMMKAKLSRMTATDDPVSESMKIAILITSPSDLTKYTATSAQTNTRKSTDLAWNYVEMRFTKT